MSNFFNDDFTAELKKYFLENLQKEADKYQDLIDDKTWKKIGKELLDLTKTWFVDAKTNEFLFLSQWLESASGKIEQVASEDELKFWMATLKSYLTDLQSGQVDSEELFKKHTAFKTKQKNILYLHCKLGTQDFAVPIINIVEITSDLKMYTMPLPEPRVAGVVAFRGDPLPVLQMTDFGFSINDHQSPVFIVCEYNGIRFVLNVDRAQDFISMSLEEMQEIGETWLAHSSCAKKIFSQDNQNILLLDLESMVAA